MLAASGVSVRLGGRLTIESVDLELNPGRIVVVIGPNGAGKSTLLRAIAGEHRLAAGRVLVHGRDIATLRPATLAGWRAVLGQTVALTTPFTSAEVVRLGVPPTMRDSDAVALASRGLSMVGLAAKAGVPITNLSGGEQQRVHVARVLVQLWAQPEDGRARYLLLDEPTAHLDLAHQGHLLRLARAHARGGGGVLAVLHDLNLAAAIADEVVVLNAGRIVARGTPSRTLTTDLLRQVYDVEFHVSEREEGLWIMPRYDHVLGRTEASVA
jgi:iron complex transport system ATP-binding protein